MVDRRRDSPTGRAGARAHVLVVDDDAEGRAALGQLLELAGYEVDLAATGECGIQLALERAPAVALVDITLPGVDGYEVARQIRSERSSRGREHREVVLVALTGRADPADRRRAEKAGFDRYLVKPVDPQYLLDLVASVSRA